MEVHRLTRVLLVVAFMLLTIRGQEVGYIETTEVTCIGGCHLAEVSRIICVNASRQMCTAALPQDVHLEPVQLACKEDVCSFTYRLRRVIRELSGDVVDRGTMSEQVSAAGAFNMGSFWTVLQSVALTTALVLLAGMVWMVWKLREDLAGTRRDLMRRMEYGLEPEAIIRIKQSTFLVLRGMVKGKGKAGGRGGRRGGKSDGADKDGVGFFYSSRRATTCDHVLEPFVGVGDRIRILFGDSGKEMVVRVTARNPTLDYAVLESEEQDAPAFIEPFLGRSSELIARNVVLCAFQVGLEKDVPNVSFDIGCMPAMISKVLKQGRHVLYSCSSWAGDSGGALVLVDGKVVAMHQESVNGVREFKRQEDVGGALETEARLKALEDSLGSVLSSTAQGGLALLMTAVA